MAVCAQWWYAVIMQSAARNTSHPSGFHGTWRSPCFTKGWNPWYRLCPGGGNVMSPLHTCTRLAGSKVSYIDHTSTCPASAGSSGPSGALLAASPHAGAGPPLLRVAWVHAWDHWSCWHCTLACQGRLAPRDHAAPSGETVAVDWWPPLPLVQGAAIMLHRETKQRQVLGRWRRRTVA